MLNIVKKTTVFNPFELLAPHSCRGCGRMGSIICNRCKNNIISQHRNYCPVCKTICPSGFCPNCPDFPQFFIIGERVDLLGDLVHAFKYDSIRALAHSFGEILDKIIPTFDTDAEVVPLPTINRHIRERGFDHTLLLAKQFAQYRHLHISKLLIRSKNTVQVGSDRHSRVAQASQAYKIKAQASIDPDKTYLLLDDVWTTGASMQAAIKKLRESGVKNIVVVLLALSRID